jgi:phenylpropionate dioxygenase-like ring-hydroxylating dioxygenase large terminal subunit
MSEATPHRWAALYPELGTGPVSTEPCVSPAFYEREREIVFKRTWLMVGRDEELPNAGDYKVKRLEFASTSIILIRGKDGAVRGFHNVCSHRGNTVVTETGDETFGSSKAAVLSCRFHGWVYNAEGGLIQVPEEERFYACFDKAENGLTSVRTEIWEGFIFINLDAEGSQSLLEFLGDYAGHMGGFPYGELSECYSYWTNLNCNWKVSHDAFAEAYHVHTIHAGSFPNTFSSGLANVRLFGPHRTAAVCLSPSAELRPVQTVADKIAGGYAGAHHQGSTLPKSVNPDGMADFSFELSVIFPNLLLHISEGLWFTHQFWPLAHNRTRWEGKMFYRPPTSNSERWALQCAQLIARNAWLEDTATMEATQTALNSGAKTEMNLQDEEILVRHGYYALEQYMQGAEQGEIL